MVTVKIYVTSKKSTSSPISKVTDFAGSHLFSINPFALWAIRHILLPEERCCVAGIN